MLFQVAYYGKTKNVINFFEQLDYHIDAFSNPADFIGMVIIVQRTSENTLWKKIGLFCLPTKLLTVMNKMISENPQIYVYLIAMIISQSTDFLLL